MPTLADYYLPVKSVYDDTPVGSTGFWEIKYRQIEGLRLMLNARNTIGKSSNGTSFVPFTAIPAFSDMHPVTLASRINDYRTKTLQLLGLSGPVLAYPKYLNTTVHASGSLENATSITRWTQNAAMTAALGKTTWTRIPSRNPFGYAASEGSLQAHDIIYKEHINEIVQMLQIMNYQIRGLENLTGNERVNNDERSGSYSGSVSCADSKSGASTDWGGNSWVAVNDTARREAYSYQDGADYAASLVNIRTKYNINLTNYTGALNPKLYLRLGKGSNTTFGQDRPISNAEGAFGNWANAALSVGSDNTTPYVDYSDIEPAFTGGASSCDTYPGTSVGWQINEIEYVFEIPEYFGLV